MSDDIELPNGPLRFVSAARVEELEAENRRLREAAQRVDAFGPDQAAYEVGYRVGYQAAQDAVMSVPDDAAVERMARAIADAVPSSTWQVWLPVARTALAALEPGDE